MTGQRRDPVDQLRNMLRAAYGDSEAPTRLREAVLEGASPRRRRRRAFYLVPTVLGLAAAGAVAAVVLDRGQPTQPHLGPGCHATPATVGDVVAAPPGNDPIKACAAIWRSGQLPDPDNPRGDNSPVPPLVACIGSGGVVEVYPYVGDCQELGLAAADEELSPENRLIVELQDRLVELNLGECLPVEDFRTAVESILDDLQMDGWELVDATDSLPADGCPQGGVDVDNRMVVVAMVNI